MNGTIRGVLAGLTVAATVAGAAVPSFAAEGAKGTPSIERAYPGESYTQYYRRGYGRGYGGGAVAAGVVGGLAVGALAGAAIAGSQPVYPAYGPGAPVGNVYGYDPNWVNYCASRYRSFDPASGTYLARDGNRYMCE